MPVLSQDTLVCSSDHEFSKLMMVCLKTECLHRCLICPMCAEYDHNGPQHQVKHIDDWKEEQIKILASNAHKSGIDHYFISSLKKSKETILNKVFELQLQMSGLIRRLRLAVNNQFETIIRSYSPHTYEQQLASLSEGLNMKKVITACYKIEIVKRNQFDSNIHKVEVAQQQYLSILSQAESQFKGIVSLTEQLKYVEELKPSNNTSSSSNMSRNKAGVTRPVQQMAIQQPSSSSANSQVNGIKYENNNIHIKQQNSRIKQKSKQKQILRQKSRSSSKSQSRSRSRSRSRDKKPNLDRTVQFLNWKKVEKLPWKQLSSNQVIDKNNQNISTNSFTNNFSSTLPTWGVSQYFNKSSPSTDGNSNQSLKQSIMLNQNKKTVDNSEKTVGQAKIEKLPKASQQTKLNINKLKSKISSTTTEPNNCSKLDKGSSAGLPKSISKQTSQSSKNEAIASSAGDEQRQIKYSNQKRPKSKPTSMSDQQLISWFRKVYTVEQVYSIVLSHRISASNKNKTEYFWYHEGEFKWVSDIYLQDCDESPRIKQYWDSLRLYAPKNK